MPVNKLLIISNGNGKDSIAAEIVRRLPRTIEVSAFPTLGDGTAYKDLCPTVGPRRHLTSEGHRPRRSLVGDVVAAMRDRPAQSFMRKEAARYDAVLVVGGMSTIAMSFLARRRVRIYLDVDKSGHGDSYSRQELFVLRRTADLVLTRDAILAGQLSAAKINARFAGNVMMDTVSSGAYDPRRHRRSMHAIAVLPSSRATYRDDFRLQLDALRRVPGIEGIDVFAILARGGDAADLAEASRLRYAPSSHEGDLGTLSDGRLKVHLSIDSVGPVVATSDIVLGQGGTFALQAVGLGKPLVSFEALGSTEESGTAIDAAAADARIVAPRNPEAIAASLARLLADPADRTRRGAIGRERLGQSGVIPAIVEELTR